MSMMNSAHLLIRLLCKSSQQKMSEMMFLYKLLHVLDVNIIVVGIRIGFVRKA